MTGVTIGAAHAETVKDAIMAGDAAFVKAYNAKDAAMVASFYTEDGAALPTNDVRVDGRAAIQKMWQGGMDYGYTDLTLTNPRSSRGW